MGFLERGSIDFLIAPRSSISRDHPAELLFSQGVSCIVCALSDAPSHTLTLGQFKNNGHVIVRFGEEGEPAFEDLYLKQHGYQRRIEVVVYGFTHFPAFVVGTKRIATLQTSLARHVAKLFPVRIKAPPMDVPATDMMLQWHSALSADPGAAWLRGVAAGNRSALVNPAASGHRTQRVP